MSPRLQNALKATAPALAFAAALTGPAAADVSPADVWSQWAGYFSAFGYTVETQPVVEGNNLRLPEFEMTMYIPADPGTGMKGGTVSLDMGEIALIDRGDGTVAIEIPASFPIRISGDGPGDKDFAATLSLMTEGHRTIASGNPGDILYDFMAGRVEVSLDEIEDDQNVMPVPGTIAITMEGAAGQNRVAGTGGKTEIEQSMTLARLIYNVEISDPNPGKEGKLNWSGEMTGLSASSSGTIPSAVDPLAIEKAILDGYSVMADMSFASGNGSFDFADPKQQMQFRSTSGGGHFRIGMSADGLDYNVLSNDVAISIAGSDIPFPIETSAAAIGAGIQMPIVADAVEQPFGASITITDMAVPDPLWMMADPGNALPHDPLTLELAISGLARLFVNVLNDAEMARLDQTGEMPGQVTRLKLDALRLSGAGATVAATGDIAVDNTSQSPIAPDLPVFSGIADLRLTGVTGLMNKLAQLGVLPAQQAFIFSGMIQQLGKAESGPDDLSARIEISPEGMLTVNGTPMPLQ